MSNLMSDELTFEQQQKVDELASKAFTPSSNSNKYRFDLYAYITDLITTQKKAARIDELFRTYTQVIGEQGVPIYSKVTKRFTEYLEFRNAQLKQLEGKWWKT